MTCGTRPSGVLFLSLSLSPPPSSIFLLAEGPSSAAPHGPTAGLARPDLAALPAQPGGAEEGPIGGGTEERVAAAAGLARSGGALTQGVPNSDAEERVAAAAAADIVARQGREGPM
jgi:hypothetical protein